ncbi:MAG: FAD/NAD(P)-binding protein [Treponema sp.]|nr:FAD/NAD(P)-binding protein [Treponema sp.]
MEKDALIPYIGVITDIRQETGDVKTFRVVGRDGKKLFEHIPGQCAIIEVPGVGESMISITSSPTIPDYQEFSIKKCGCVTTWLHSVEPGQEIAVRGPLGNGFPVETSFKGKNLLFVAGGIGLAPLHSVINYVRAHREKYGKVMIVYGSRSKQDLVTYKEISEEWMKEKDFNVCLTIDKAQPDWDGHVGFVPTYVKELNPDPSYTVIMCGPPILIHLTLAGLKELGFKDTQVFTTMEMRMKCGIGKCGRCNIGDKYVCKDGPVFSFDQLGELPPEY